MQSTGVPSGRRRTRADPEALIATSPVGVLVFDAGTSSATGFVRSGTHSPHTDGQRTRILVVDHPQTLGQVRDTLAVAGYFPLVTGNPRKAPRLIQANRPRLVLLDPVLPGMDGIESMQDVPEIADLPVISISAR